MADAFRDLADIASITRKNGVIRAVTRRIRIHGVTGTNGYDKLYDALKNPNVPDDGSTLTSSVDGEFAMLRLDNTKVKMVEEGVADVDLEYLHVLDGPQEIEADTVVFGRIRSSLIQVPTNFYYGYTDPDDPTLAAPIQIVVSHVFPDGSHLDPDTGKPEVPDSLYPGQRIYQGGEIQVQVPQKTYVLEGFINTTAPWEYVAGLNGVLNSTNFLDEPPRTWLCTDVRYEFVNLTRCKFYFEFQHNIDTWDSSVVFIDPRTGLPPKRLVGPGGGHSPPNVGFFTVPWLDEDDYHSFFPGVVFADSLSGT